MYTMNSITVDELVGNEYKFASFHPLYAISKEGEVVAYLSGYTGGCNEEFAIEMIEVLNKEQGIGTEIVRWLFDELSVERLIGYILKEGRSYYFWDSLGAEIDLLEEGFTIDELIQEGLQSSFALYR